MAAAKKAVAAKKPAAKKAVAKKLMPASKDITIRFCFDKGEGEYIEISKFSEDELADIRKCLSLDLCYFPQEQTVAKIISVQIIHDGITPVEDGEIEGYYISREDEYLLDGNPLDGYPTPIVRFLLDRAMDGEEFRQCIFGSSYNVCTKSMQQNDECYFAEDHNGYTSVLSSKQRDHMINYLQINDAYCGTIFNFPDGLPEEGHLIPALEFALKP